MTVDEFLAWTPPYDADRWELIEGLPVAMTVAPPRHGAILAQAARLLATAGYPYYRAIVSAGVQPRQRAEINVRIPDLAVTSEPIGPDTRLLRNPILLVEVIEPSAIADVWANVRSCQTIPSVREVLVLHTEPRAELLRRQDDGTWPDDPTPLTAADTVTLASIDFAAPLAEFYR